MYYGVYYGYAMVGVATKELRSVDAEYYVLECVDFVKHFKHMRKEIISQREFNDWWLEHRRYTSAYTVANIDCVD